MQSSLSTNVVIDLGSTKQAALFFDHVIPLDGVEGVSGVGRVLTSSGTVDFEKAQFIISQLLPPDFGTDKQVIDFASVAAIGISAITIAVGFYNCDEMSQKANEYGAKLEAPAGSKKYITGGPVTVDPKFLDIECTDTSQTERAIVSIANILVPDTQELGWDAIIEFRRDEQARQRLRRLRVFAANEYAGKSRNYIEDDLCLRMDDYVQTLKSWNIKTVLGALSTCLSLETTLQTGMANVAAILSGLPPANAFAASLSIPVARFALELGSVRLAREDAIRQYPMAYITDVKKLTK